MHIFLYVLYNLQGGPTESNSGKCSIVYAIFSITSIKQHTEYRTSISGVKFRWISLYQYRYHIVEV